MKTDFDIQQDVLRELAWDTRLKATAIGVAVDQGIVTLTGTVGSYAARMGAQDAAHRVEGVLDVANDLEVKLPGDATRTDTEIAQAVRQALEWDVLVPDERIQSTVSNGWVTLRGTVDYATERQDAERAVRHLAGVRGVTNGIFVIPPTLSAPQIAAEITGALERRAERAAKRIQVEIQDGTVTLRGPVHSWAERDAVVGAARFTPGVRGVDAHLHIEPTY